MGIPYKQDTSSQSEKYTPGLGVKKLKEDSREAGETEGSADASHQ